MAVGNSIKCFFTPIPCEKCILLEELLRHETERKEYFEQLLLANSGVLHTEAATPVGDLINFPTIHKMSTMSSLRKQAAVISARVATEKEKTAGEIKFEQALEEAN